MGMVKTLFSPYRINSSFREEKMQGCFSQKIITMFNVDNVDHILDSRCAPIKINSRIA
jgi:hypothetical protein